MIIYNFDDNKIFVGCSEAMIDPLETEKKGSPVYLIPANSTIIKTQEYGDNEIPAWNGDAWDIFPDYRGQFFWDKETQEEVYIERIGEISENLTQQKPMDYCYWDYSQEKFIEKSPEQIREDKLNLTIIPERNRLLAETDWTQLNDCQLSNTDKEKYKVYRQVLRDLPETINPENPVWPEMPV